MNKAKRILQLSASIISSIVVILYIIVFIDETNYQMYLYNNIVGDMLGYSVSYTQVLIMALILLPSVIINCIMFKNPKNQKIYRALRITMCALLGFYLIYLGPIAFAVGGVNEDMQLYYILYSILSALFLISLLLFIISFCVGNPKKKKLFVEDADLKIQTICRLQQMNLITKEEAKHFIFIQATK